MNPLSPYLEKLAKQDLYEWEVLEELNRLPTIDLQDAALHEYAEQSPRQKVQWAKQIVDKYLQPQAAKADPSPEPPVKVLFQTPAANEHTNRPSTSALVQPSARPATTTPSKWIGRIQRTQSILEQHSWIKYGLVAASVWFVSVAGTFLMRLHWPFHETASEQAVSPTPPRSDAPVPPFTITSATYVDGNKLELHWPDLGAGYRYKVFENCHPGDTAYTPKPVTDQVVDTPGALVNMPDDAFCSEPEIQVQAILPNGAAGPITGPVKFRVSPLNNEMYSVEPLEMEATAGTENGRTAAARSGGAPVNRRPRESGSGSLSKKEYQSPPGQVASGDQYGQPLHPQGVRAPLRVADVPGSSPTGVPPSSQASKSSVFSAFTHALIKNSDGSVITAVPNVAVGAGLVAVKNAAVSAHDERAPSTVRPVPVPSGFTGRYVDERTIYLEWNPVGPGYTYAVFASPIEPLDFTYNDPENDDPIRDPRVNWNIPKGKGSRFLFEVRAVDPQGRQSASSTRIEVDVL